MPRYTAITALGAAAVLWLAGCAGSRPPRRVLEPLMAHQLLQRLPEAVEPSPFQTNQGTLVLENKGRRDRLTASLLYAHPDRIRLDLYTFGMHVWALGVSGTCFTAFTPGHKQALTGPVTSGLLKDMAGVAITPQEIGLLLQGTIGIGPRARAGVAGEDVVDGWYVLTCRETDGLVRYWINPEGFRVERKEWFDDRGAVVKSLSLEAYREWDGGMEYPGRAVLAMPADRVKVRMEYEERLFGTPLADTDFEVPIPDGVPLVRLGGE